MESTWQHTLTRLQEYVKSNPSIKIAGGITILPEDVRPGFYALFDRIENDFVRQNFPQYVEKGLALGAAWTAVSRDAVSRMKIESLAISPALRWFLADPVDGLSRYFSDDLFAVLKNDIDAKEFEVRCLKRVPPMFAEFFKEGYLRWAETALLGALAADEVFRIPAVDEIADPLMGEGHENPGQRITALPLPEPANAISFQQHPIISFVVPKVLVHSARLGRYASMHSEFVEPYWAAREVSRKVEWLNFTALKRDHGAVKPRADLKFPANLGKILPDVLIYTSDELEDLVLVADHARIARPDIAVEVMEEPDWFEKGKLAAVKLHHKLMTPRFGTFIICREAPPQAAVEEMTLKQAENPMPAVGESADSVVQPAAKAPAEIPDIHFITAAYDASCLETVIGVLG